MLFSLFLSLIFFDFPLIAEPNQKHPILYSSHLLFTSRKHPNDVPNRTPIFVSGKLEKNGNIKIKSERLPNSSILMIVPSFSVWNESMTLAFLEHFSSSLQIILKKNLTTKGLVLDAEFGAKQSQKFYTELVCSIHKLTKKIDPNLQLYLALFPPIHPDQHGYYDWDSLFRCSDRWIIMLYDEHNPRTEPGTVSSTRWIEENLNAIEAKLNKGENSFPNSIESIRQKVYLGLPLYGYAKTKLGRFGKVIPIKNWINNFEFRNATEDSLEVKMNDEVIYLPTKHFFQHWKKESQRLGYAGVAYWREEFLGENPLPN